MPTDEAEPAGVRQVFDKGSDVSDYERRCAAEIVEMIRNSGLDASTCWHMPPPS